MQYDKKFNIETKIINVSKLQVHLITWLFMHPLSSTKYRSEEKICLFIFNYGPMLNFNPLKLDLK
jgi:hypothetical protein